MDSSFMGKAPTPISTSPPLSSHEAEELQAQAMESLQRISAALTTRMQAHIRAQPVGSQVPPRPTQRVTLQVVPWPSLEVARRS